MLSYASLLIAFFATAGAIPLCGALAARMSKDASLDQPAPAPPRVAGAGILSGAFLSFFYLQPSATGAILPLLAGIAATVAATWLHRRYVARLYLDGYYPRAFAASMLVTLLVLLPGAEALQPNYLGDIALVAAVFLTPLAIAVLGRSGPTSRGLPMAIVLVQLALLLVLSLAAMPMSAAQAGEQSLFQVALPIIGALAAALIYLCRTPWRPAGVISAGSGTRLSLGLVVAWGAMSLRTEEGPHVVALLWILGIPIFELLRRCALLALHRIRAGVSGRPYARRMAIAPSPSVVLACTAVAGSAGILFEHLPVASGWSIHALVAVMLTYWIFAAVMQPWSRAEQDHVVDVPR
jgi:hypothetical protein